MDEAKIYDTLAEIFATIFWRQGVVLRAELTAKDVPGWDSFKQIEIIMAAETQFGIIFGTEELEQLASVGDLVTAIQRHITARAGSASTG